MQSNGSTDAVTPLRTPNLTLMDDGDATRHEMAPRARGGGAPPWYGFKQLLTLADLLPLTLNGKKIWDGAKLIGAPHGVVSAAYERAMGWVGMRASRNILYVTMT